MIPRYSREVMARIWTEENKFASWLKVELAAMAAMAECGIIPKEVPARVVRQGRLRRGADPGHRSQDPP